MRLSIQFTPATRIDLEFGYNTPMFIGMYWFSIVKVYLDKDDTIEFASLIFNCFKHPKYWNNRIKKVGFVKLHKS